eukprot:2321024-Rhodomonas_salina.2
MPRPQPWCPIQHIAPDSVICHVSWGLCVVAGRNVGVEEHATLRQYRTSHSVIRYVSTGHRIANA